jgi:hypothetical protein
MNADRARPDRQCPTEATSMSIPGSDTRSLLNQLFLVSIYGRDVIAAESAGPGGCLAVPHHRCVAYPPRSRRRTHPGRSASPGTDHGRPPPRDPPHRRPAWILPAPLGAGDPHLDEDSYVRRRGHRPTAPVKDCPMPGSLDRFTRTCPGSAPQWKRWPYSVPGFARRQV